MYSNSSSQEVCSDALKRMVREEEKNTQREAVILIQKKEDSTYWRHSFDKDSVLKRGWFFRRVEPVVIYKRKGIFKKIPKKVWQDTGETWYTKEADSWYAPFGVNKKTPESV